VSRPSSTMARRLPIRTSTKGRSTTAPSWPLFLPMH
jgi:hypothetical protein